VPMDCRKRHCNAWVEIKDSTTDKRALAATA
jgi:hypothetical protein